MKTLTGRILRNRTFPILLIRVFHTLSITLIFIFLSRGLQPEIYGNYITFWTTLTLGISIGSLGMGSVLYNFSLRGWIEYVNQLKPRTTLSYSLFILILTISGTAFLRHHMDGIGTLSLICIAVIFIASIFSFILDNALIIIERSFLQLGLNILYASALIYIHYDFLNGHQQFDRLFPAYALIISGKALIQFVIFKISGRRLCAQSDFDRQPLIRPDKGNWIQMSIHEVFQFAMRYLDKFVMSIIATKEASAIYFNGRQEIPLISALYSSMGHGLLIRLSQQFNIEDKDVIASINKTMKKLGSIILCVVIFCWVYSEDIFIVVFTEKYLPSVPVFKAGLLLLPAQFLISLTYILQYKNHSRLINRGAYYDAILTLLLVFPMYSILGSVGIILSIVISTYLQNIYYLIRIAGIYKRPAIDFLPIRYYGSLIITYLIIAWGSHYIFSHSLTTSWKLLMGIMTGGILSATMFYYQMKKSS